MQKESISTSHKLQFFPIMMFAIIMGMGGLSIMYQKAALFLGLSSWIGYILMGITSVLFIVISSIYTAKIIWYLPVVKQEFSHPVRINFFAAVSISMLMLAILYKEEIPLVSACFWYAGTLLQFYLTMRTIAFWINHNQVLEHSSPAWFIPVVGNVLVPVGGVGFASDSFLMYFLSVGIFFWIILFAILLNRIIFHHQMPAKFMPTMFIFIAPPAVGFIAYIKLFEHVDTFATVLFNLALFFTLLVAFMYKNFIKIEFFISWWAFVFPLAAMAISSMLMFYHTHEQWLYWFSYGMLSVTTVVVLIVSYQTISHIKKGKICVQE